EGGGNGRIVLSLVPARVCACSPPPWPSPDGSSHGPPGPAARVPRRRRVRLQPRGHLPLLPHACRAGRGGPHVSRGVPGRRGGLVAGAGGPVRAEAEAAHEGL
ncbi:MAG: hypothetical protein AVDCRST_MAG68-1902, partial [uncultured Gemmatimonadetes bacterium]